MTVMSIPKRAVGHVATRRRVLVRPTTHLAHLTRYRGGTYSHTVDTIVFADGSSARTDLIRLNPNVHAYSLDFTGIAPHHPSRYRLGTWATLPHLHTRGYEAAVDWILRRSFPMRPIAELSRQLRKAGYPLGAAHLNEHEAIAATQAAIWYFTNGLALDTRPLNVPIAVRRGPGPVISFEFDGEPQLGGYSAWVASDAAVGLKLQKSANGIAWQDISRSQVIAGPGTGHHRRTLGVGSTLSASSHGGGGRGYRYYRLVATTEADNPTIDHVRFWLTGARHYRNADRVVHLYNYLITGARKALRDTVEPQLVDTQATARPELIGPFQVPIPLRLSVTEGHTLVDGDGEDIDDIVQPGTDFYLRPALGTSTTTVTATTPHNLTGRVLTGVALEGASHRFTPIALTVPTNVAVEFDITWQADEPCTDIA
ncbi:MAG TPA: thioester domain-containing protein [Mycobacterium sp.]|nr:thioester domain-containing protein [Mycobacterium sp.]HTX93427.1 thioester domain-containing protein [Mycobacterium sp.]